MQMASPIFVSRIPVKRLQAIRLSGRSRGLRPSSPTLFACSAASFVNSVCTYCGWPQVPHGLPPVPQLLRRGITGRTERYPARSPTPILARPSPVTRTERTGCAAFRWRFGSDPGMQAKPSMVTGQGSEKSTRAGSHPPPLACGCRDDLAPCEIKWRGRDSRRIQPGQQGSGPAEVRPDRGREARESRSGGRPNRRHTDAHGIVE